jgi:hypothetical protein
MSRIQLLGIRTRVNAQMTTWRRESSGASSRIGIFPQFLSVGTPHQLHGSNRRNTVLCSLTRRRREGRPFGWGKVCRGGSGGCAAAMRKALGCCRRRGAQRGGCKRRPYPTKQKNGAAQATKNVRFVACGSCPKMWPAGPTRILENWIQTTETAVVTGGQLCKIQVLNPKAVRLLGPQDLNLESSHAQR